VQDHILKAAREHRLSPTICIVGEDSDTILNFALEAVRIELCEEQSAKDCACSQCRLIRNRTHPDVTLVAPEGKAEIISVESIRNVRREAYQAPFQASTKWIVIHQAHRLNVASSNALLKILEEPPEATKFFLLTTNDRLLLPTIRSRCFVYPVSLTAPPRTLPSEIEEIAADPDRSLAILNISSLLSGYSLAEASEILAELSRKTRDALWGDASYEIFSLLADRPATYQKRLVLESILLSCFNERKFDQ